MVVKIFWPSEVKGKCLWGVAICKTETTREGFDHPTVKPCTKLALMPHPLGHWVNGYVGWDHYCMKHKKTRPKALRAKCRGTKGRPEQ